MTEENEQREEPETHGASREDSRFDVEARAKLWADRGAGWWGCEQLLGTATRLDSVVSPIGERKREGTGEVGKEEGKTQMVYD